MKTVDTKRSGFTIVELIITVIVIAILAGIILVSYRGIRENADSTAALSDLATARDQLKIHTIKNAAPSDISEAGVDTTSKSTFDYWLYDLPSGAVYCLSATRGAASHYVWSHQNTPPRPGSCTEAASLDTENFLGLNDEPGAKTITPATSANGMILYVGFRVIDTTGAYNSIAAAGPLSTSNRLQLDTDAAGSASLRGRVDVSSGTNLVLSRPGTRTAGDHVGWILVRDNTTVRELNFDSPAVGNSGTIPVNTHLSISNLTMYTPGDSIEPVTSMVFKASHDEQARAIVLEWIKRKYSLAPL